MLANRMRIGRFTPDALLGQDSATATYRARDGEDLSGEGPQHYVLKVVKSRSAVGDGALAADFAETARAYSGILLPGIATPVEIGEGPGPVYAAFPYYEGVDLSILRAQALPGPGVFDPRLCLILAKKIVERLQSLHAHAEGPRIHGGIAPGNILVSPRGDIWLLDCGLGEAIFLRHGIWPSHWLYLSPEQLRGQPATVASDLFSLGAALYFLAFGRPPFLADDPAALEKVMAGAPPSFEGLTTPVATIFSRLLSHDPRKRIQSCGEALRRISVALLSMNANLPAPSPPPATRPLVSDGNSVPKVEKTFVEASSGSEPPLVPSVWEDPSRFTGFRAAFDRAVESAEEESMLPPEPVGEVEKPRIDFDSLPNQPALAGDDPEVGAVFDDDEDEEFIEEVGKDGKVRRRKRPKSFRLVDWTRSAFARRLFRWAWVPMVVLLFGGAAQGYLWYRSYRNARADSARLEKMKEEERQKEMALRPKLPEKAVLPPGHLKINVTPAGAMIWIDGAEKGTSPVTLLTQPGVHRLVITANGYRMLRDVVDTSRGAEVTREMAPAVFPMEGSVSLNVGCATTGKYPVFIDGRDIGVLCPIAGIRLEPGRHVAGIFVIPQDRMWTVEREILPEKPQRVLFSY